MTDDRELPAATNDGPSEVLAAALSVAAGAAATYADGHPGRIGDRVTNIAEDVVFHASGEIEDLNP